VYGASSAVGSYAIKLARNSNIHPIIAVAGKGTHYVETLLDRAKGDTVLDYRNGTDETISQIRAHLKAGNYGEVYHGLDPGIGVPSQKVLTEIVAPNGAINLVLPSNFDVGSATRTTTNVGLVHNQGNGADEADGSDLGFVTSRWFARAWQAGKFDGHPFEVRPGGLEGVEQALKDLKDGKQSAVKYVFRIADTPGL
jgi:NADPH2:quinone reductase